MRQTAALQPSLDQWDHLPFVRKKVYEFLNDKIPTRMKRLIFSASLLGILEPKELIESKTMSKRMTSIFVLTAEDRRIVHKLNSILNLSKHSESSLMFPVIVRSMIWGDLKKDPYIEIDHHRVAISDIEAIKKYDPDLNYLTAFLVSQMPLWLIYGSYNLVHHDVSLLMHKVLT